MYKILLFTLLICYPNYQKLDRSQFTNHQSPITNPVHAYHNSLTEMRLNTKDKIFEVEIKVFTDDFEKVLSKESKSVVKIADNDKNDALISKYLQKHFIVQNTKNQPKPYTYLGKQTETDATWLIVELPMNEPVNGFKIQNDLLMDMFDDQINLLNIILPTERKSYLFNVKERVQTVF